MGDYFSKTNLPKKEIIHHNVQDDDEKRIFESRVINACIKKQLEVIQEYLESKSYINIIVLFSS